MPLPTPSPTDTIIYQNDQILSLLKSIAAALAKDPNITSPAPAPAQPSGPSAAEQIAAFKAKYTPLSLAVFRQKYGVDFKAKLPALQLPLDPTRVMEYAQNGYNVDGAYVGGPMVSAFEGHTPEQVAESAIDEIAHGKAGHWSQPGYDPDVIAVAVMSGMLVSPGYERDFFGAGGSQVPGYYRNVAFPDFVNGIKSIAGPSGGQG